MSAPELERVVEAVVGALDRLEVPYHITGGLASSYYGEPRFTQDVDFVIRIEPGEAERLVRGLEGEFLSDVESVREAVRRRGMFQALHRELLIKADFHVGESIAGELERSQVVQLFPGLDVRLVSKEDAILSKLLWARQGSDKGRGDVLGMLLDPTAFDLGFVKRLAGTLDCIDLLEEIERERDDL